MAGLTELMLSNGERITLYTDANAVGSHIRCSKNLDATSGSPFKLRVSSNCMILDEIVTTTTAGECEVIANGNPTGKKITSDQRFVNSIANRKSYAPKFGFRKGVDYMFIARATYS